MAQAEGPAGTEGGARSHSVLSAALLGVGGVRGLRLSATLHKRHKAPVELTRDH